MDVTVLSRNARSWETISAAPRKRLTNLPAIRAFRCRDGWSARQARADVALQQDTRQHETGLLSAAEMFDRRFERKICQAQWTQDG